MFENRKGYPGRTPKRYPNKDLHGRIRMGALPYKNVETFKKFYIDVFGWDMFVLKVPSNDEIQNITKPTIMVATGPSQITWEGLEPGLMNVTGTFNENNTVPEMLLMEVHMDRPLQETADKITALGGQVYVIEEHNEDGFVDGITFTDPAGNLIRGWKCPPSRTWEEPEADYDKD